jgi:S-layer homology domain/IPT/TIG domain
MNRDSKVSRVAGRRLRVLIALAVLGVAYGAAPTAVAKNIVRDSCGQPGISGVDPGFGSTDTQVTIQGCGLLNVSEVDFGDTPATNFHVKSDTSITAYPPEGEDGQTVSVSAVSTTCATLVSHVMRKTASGLGRRSVRPANAHPCSSWSSTDLPSKASFSYVFGELDMSGPFPHYYRQGEADLDWQGGIGHQEIWPTQPGPFAFTGTDPLVFHITTAFTDDTTWDSLENTSGFAQGSGNDSGQFKVLGNTGGYGASLQMCTVGNGLDQKYGQCTNYDGNTGWWEDVPSTYQSDSLTSPGKGGTVYGDIKLEAPGVFLAPYYGGAVTYRIAWNLQETDSNGGSGLYRAASGFSPGFDVFINAPVAYAQMTVQPYSIIYQPPGDASYNTVATKIGLGTDTKLGNSVTNSNSYTQTQTDSANFSASLAYVLGVNFDNSFNWDTKTVDSFGTTDDASDETTDKVAIATQTKIGPDVSLVPGDGATCFSPTDCSTADLVHPSAQAQLMKEPFWDDLVVLEVHPQYDVYQTPLGTRFVMQASTPTLASIRVALLEECRLHSGDPGDWTGGKDPCLVKYADRETGVSGGNGVYTKKTCSTPPKPTDACIELTPQDAANLLALDPFYLGGQGADVETHRGIPMPPVLPYGVSGPSPGPNETPDEQDESWDNLQSQTHTTGTVQTSKIDYSDMLTTKIGGGYTLGGGVSGFNAKESLTLGAGETQGTDSSEQTQYSDSTAASTTQESTVSVALEDWDNTTPAPSGLYCKICHPPMPDQPEVNVYLDRMFGTFMYQDPNTPPRPPIPGADVGSYRAAVAQLVLAQMINQAVSGRSFDDVSRSSPAREAIAFLTRFGDMSGFAGNKFQPNAPMTEIQLATALGNMVQLTPERTLVLLTGSPREPNVAVTESALATGLAKALKLNPAAARAYLTSVLGNFSAQKLVTRGDGARVLFAALQTRCLEGCSYNPIKPATVPIRKIFSVVLDPPSGLVQQGQSTSTTVGTHLVSGTKETLKLSASGLAAVGVTATVRPTSLQAGRPARLSITTSSSTPAGTYPITVTAKGASSTVTTTYDLTVTAVKVKSSFSTFECSSTGPTDLSCNGMLTSGATPFSGGTPLTGAFVTLTYTPPSGKAMVRTMNTNADGFFNDQLGAPSGPPLTAGIWHVQAHYAGDTTTKPISGSQSVVVQSPPTAGTWTRLGLEQGLNGATLVHLPNGNDMVVWSGPSGLTQHYDWVQLKPTGGMVSPPRDVFGGHDWGELGSFPDLLLENGKPLLIFQGGEGLTPNDPYNDGCIVGDLLTAGGWKLQPWSLSQGCSGTDQFGATISRNGTLSAAWAFGGIRYRIGASPSIPAATPDQLITIPQSDQGSVGVATETRSQNVYAAWDRFFSGPSGQPSYPKDGVYVADLTKRSKPIKAPDTGTNLVAVEHEPVSIASPSVRGGIYVAYCNNTFPCSQVNLWQYGARRAVTVPGSSHPTSVVLSAGPSGRLWIAWWSEQDGTVNVVRTNRAGNAFGPVERNPGPDGCIGDGNATIAISSGSQQRLDVVVGCYGVVSGTNYQKQTYAIQSLVPLQIAATTGTIDHKTGGHVTYRVSDVGDAVPGATVTVDGKTAITDAKGQVTFRFPQGSRTGRFKVVASMADYLNASTLLGIT